MNRISIFYSIALSTILIISYSKICAFSSSEESMCSNYSKSSNNRALLPKKLIVGYANWNQCDDKLIEAVQNGVNTLIWFSIDLAYNTTTGKPYINRGPDPDCVANITKQIRNLGLETVHLISIGGWNSPHPDTKNTAQETFTEFKRWNEQVIARPSEGFYGYDGFDWDIEGNDDFSSVYNKFTVECLDFMGIFSQLAKQNNYIVSMAPAESYLDPTTSLFDRDLTHVYEEWDPIVPNFNYHGRNVYAYLISRYGTYQSSLNESASTFDFIMVQLYEGYSHCLFNTSIQGQNAGNYIRNIVQKFDQGWFVDFESDSGINWESQNVRVEPERLLIGLANGWADNSKFLLLKSKEICEGYKLLEEIGKDVKGFGFWNIFDEGHLIPNGEELWLAKDLDKILEIRDFNGTDLC